MSGIAIKEDAEMCRCGPGAAGPCCSAPGTATAPKSHSARRRSRCPNPIVGHIQVREAFMPCNEALGSPLGPRPPGWFLGGFRERPQSVTGWRQFSWIRVLRAQSFQRIRPC